MTTLGRKKRLRAGEARLVATALVMATLACGDDSGVAPNRNDEPEAPEGPSLDEEGAWVDVARMPVPVVDAAIAAYRGAIYVTGGRPDSAGAAPGAAVQRYDPTEDSWSRLEDLPTVLAEHAMTVFRDTLLILGGNRSQSSLAPTSTILAYDPDSDGWSVWGNLPAPIRRAQAVSVDDRILVLGGSGFEAPPGDSITIIEDRTRWRFAPPPGGGFGLDVVPGILSGRAYVLTAPPSFPLELWEFDMASETWSQVGVNAVFDARVVGAALDDRLHLLGDGRPAPKHRAYLPGAGSRWLSLTPPEEALVGRLVAGFEGRLYVFGGYPLATGRVARDALAYVPPS